MLPNLTKIFHSKKSKKCKVIQMLVEFHQSRTAELAPVTASTFKVACWKPAPRTCKCSSSTRRKTSMDSSNTATSIIRILKMREDRSKWQSRIWRRWMLKRGASTSTWPNQCTNLCKLSLQDTRLSSMPSVRRRWWIKMRRSKSWKMNSNKTWSSKKMMTFKHSQVVPKAISASFPNHKRFRLTISPQKNHNHFNFSGNSSPCRNSTILGRQRSLLKCRVDQARRRQIKLIMEPIIRLILNRKTRMPKSKGRKIRRRYPQMHSIKLILSARLRKKLQVRQMRPKRRKHCRSRSCWTKAKCSLINLTARSKRSHRLTLQNPKIRTRFSFKKVRKLTKNRKPKLMRSSKWCRTRISLPTNCRLRRISLFSRLQRSWAKVHNHNQRHNQIQLFNNWHKQVAPLTPLNWSRKARPLRPSSR